MSYESPPTIQTRVSDDGTRLNLPSGPFKVRFNSPFLPQASSFIKSAETLGLHATTCSMLDDIAFLINTALSLPADPTPQQLEKVKSTASWIHDRLCELPKQISSEAEMSSARSYGAEVRDTLDEADEAIPHSLLPDYPGMAPSRSSQSTTESPTAEAEIRDQSREISRALVGTKAKWAPDPLYSIVRLAAPIYARAISTRQPFSAVCNSDHAFELVCATWRVPLARWRSMIGTFVFALLSILPLADSDCPNLRPHAGFVKSIVQIGFAQMAIENWKMFTETMARALKLQAWLQGGGDQERT
jgi:hypothetical protein